MTKIRTLAPQHAILAIAAAFAASNAHAQILTQGPTSSRTPYLVPTAPVGVVTNITSLATATDLVALTGGASGATYEIGGLPDGLGAYDNNNGTITVLVNHEFSATSGVIRRHGARGAYVEELILDKATLAVISGQDLMANVIDGTGIVHNATNANAIAFQRFCAADLPSVSAFYNAATGLGTQERVFMNGEEGGTTGYAVAHVATGADKGNSYILPKFNLATNGSGITAVGGWENVIANPYAQDLTFVIGTNDGGTGIMNNSVAVYLGTKQSTGNVVEKAGLTNGTLSFINVTGNTAEIVNTTTRATNIVNGTRFSLSGTASTTFSRPEDGAWNPANPRQFYFVTTDRLDTLTTTGPNPTSGATGTAQNGMSRLWRLTFDDVTNPSLGGVIDLLIDGGKNGQKVQMFDNMTVAADGRIYLNEDPGNTTYIGKVWSYDPTSDTLVQLAKFDPARWGELAAAGGTPGAIAPQTNDKETSGVIDVTSILPGAPGETVLLMVAQDHSTNPAVATASSVEGGQHILMKVKMGASVNAYGVNCGQPGMSIQSDTGSLPRVGQAFVSRISRVPATSAAAMSLGLSNTTLNGSPLPLSLNSYGLPGCFLYHDAAFGFAFPCTAAGPTSALFTLNVPSSQVFVGMKVFLQAWAPDATANAGGLIGTNALEIKVGL